MVFPDCISIVSIELENVLNIISLDMQVRVHSSARRASDHHCNTMRVPPRARNPVSECFAAFP